MSNSMIVQCIIVAAILIAWVITCWIAWLVGQRKGYTECMTSIRNKKRAKREASRHDDIRVLKPEPSSVRIVSTRTVNGDRS